MTVRKHVIFSDDITGTEKDVKTVTFGYEGKTFEIDLGAGNRKNLERSLAKYIAAARPVKAASKPVKGEKRDLAPVRAWARENGHEVGEKGRIAATIIEAYDKATVTA